MTSRMTTLTDQKLLVRPYSGEFGKYLNRQIPENTLLDQLKELRDHCHLVIGVNGDYVSQIH